MSAEDDIDGDASFDEEVEIRAAMPGQRCSVCRQRIVEGDRVRIAATSAHAPLTVTHVRCKTT
jgi:hypothetical protein